MIENGIKIKSYYDTIRSIDFGYKITFNWALKMIFFLSMNVN